MSDTLLDNVDLGLLQSLLEASEKNINNTAFSVFLVEKNILPGKHKVETRILIDLYKQSGGRMTHIKKPENIATVLSDKAYKIKDVYIYINKSQKQIENMLKRVKDPIRVSSKMKLHWERFLNDHPKVTLENAHTKYNKWARNRSICRYFSKDEITALFILYNKE